MGAGAQGGEKDKGQQPPQVQAALALASRRRSGPALALALPERHTVQLLALLPRERSRTCASGGKATMLPCLLDTARNSLRGSLRDSNWVALPQVQLLAGASPRQADESAAPDAAAAAASTGALPDVDGSLALTARSADGALAATQRSADAVLPFDPDETLRRGQPGAAPRAFVPVVPGGGSPPSGRGVQRSPERS
eukprot:gene387-biopygen2189